MQEWFGDVEFDVAYYYVGCVNVGRDGFLLVFQNEGQRFLRVGESLVRGFSEGDGFAVVGDYGLVAVGIGYEED